MISTRSIQFVTWIYPLVGGHQQPLKGSLKHPKQVHKELPGTNILLMEEILHQLRLVVYPIIYRVLAPSRVVVWDF